MAFCRRPNPVFGAEYEQLRDVLRRARRRSGLSQRDLASRIGKCSSHVAMIERGQRRIDVLVFCLIARTLGSDPAQLLLEAIAGL